MNSSLTSQVVRRNDLTCDDVATLFALFNEHFSGVTYVHFVQDLANKDWVILLRDGEQGCIQGFSTLAHYQATFAGAELQVVCSGDTIIRPAFWGSPALSQTWIKHVLTLAEETAQPLYWLLISSGYKTYRFLTVFYKNFYPRYDQPTPPPCQQLIDHLAAARYGDEYDPHQGIVRFVDGATPLRPGIADVGTERLQDPHIAFFTQRNPGYLQGDELACLTQIHPDNLTAAGRRMIR